MLGLVITPNYTMYKKEFGEPMHKTVGAVVGGYVEHVLPIYLPQPFCLLIDEEGKLNHKPINPVASGWYSRVDPIVGTAVVMKDGYVDGERDIVGLTEEECEKLIDTVVYMSDEEYRLIDEPKEEENAEEN